MGNILPLSLKFFLYRYHLIGLVDKDHVPGKGAGWGVGIVAFTLQVKVPYLDTERQRPVIRDRLKP